MRLRRPPSRGDAIRRPPADASGRVGPVCAGFALALLMLGCKEAGRAEGSPPEPAVSQVLDAFVVAPAIGSPAAMYLTVTNPSDAPDMLTTVETAAAERAELHRTVEHGAMLHMAPAGAIELPARGQIRLEPGGYHVMLVGTRAALSPGDTIEAALILGRGGRVDFRACVVTYQALAEGPGGSAGCASDH
ncbi:MAG: copper chaperone PCu(A)C [Gemmatimonadota bacterium]|nr:copper chaperone PCu(A)C [Gemmatimonadota bacterium]